MRPLWLAFLRSQCNMLLKNKKASKTCCFVVDSPQLGRHWKNWKPQELENKNLANLTTQGDCPSSAARYPFWKKAGHPGPQKKGLLKRTIQNSNWDWNQTQTLSQCFLCLKRSAPLSVVWVKPCNIKRFFRMAHGSHPTTTDGRQAVAEPWYISGWLAAIFVRTGPEGNVWNQFQLRKEKVR